MVANSKEIVTNVVSSMVDARSIDFHELHSEFETSSQDISNLIEVSAGFYGRFVLFRNPVLNSFCDMLCLCRILVHALTNVLLIPIPVMEAKDYRGRIDYQLQAAQK
jgi:hypothetical protein